MRRNENILIDVIPIFWLLTGSLYDQASTNLNHHDQDVIHQVLSIWPISSWREITARWMNRWTDSEQMSIIITIATLEHLA